MPRTSRASTPTLAKKGKKARAHARKPAQDDLRSRDPTVEPPSAAQLLNQSVQTTEDWFKSVRTKKGYANYVKNGKKLLKEWTTGDGANQDGGGFVGSNLDRDELGKAFDEITEHTPTALRLVMAYKCEHMGRAFATAEGLRSAFKHFFERVHGCQGEFWKHNSHTRKWEGNPVFQSDFKAYYESLKNRDNRTGTSTQALPMLPKDMKIIMDFLDSPEAVEHMGLTKRLYFKAFATTAFTLWARNDELINIQMKDIEYGAAAAGTVFLEFRLVFRKTNKDPTKGQIYHIPADLDNPEIDCFTHMSAWLRHLQELIGRPLVPSDFIFPAIASTGSLKFGECTSRSGIETLMEDIVERSGVMRGRHGRFTTHCFRRGGAQYRFMWAPRKWSLKAIKWWGGWSSSENVGTIMRYLLDELTAYEDGFTDVMMPDRSPERHETFMGIRELSSTPSRRNLVILENSLLTRVEHVVSQMQSSPLRCGTAPSMNYDDGNIVGSGLQLPAFTSTRPIDPVLAPSLSTTPQHIHASGTSQAPPSLASPRPSRIPETNSLDDVLRYWESGAPEKGLLVPLRSWDVFDPSEYASEAVKLGNIKFVRDEFAIRCKGDLDLFESSYPGLLGCYTKLLKAVRVARQQRGEAKYRRSRKRK